MHSLPRRLAAIMLLAALIAPLGGRPAAQAAPAAPAQPAQNQPRPLPPILESEGAGNVNNRPQTAGAIGSVADQRWAQQIQGTIGSSGDVDYFRFTLTQPASAVRLNLDGLVADYDLLLAVEPANSPGFEPGREGLEDVTEIGGQISSIGGQISSIGGQISSIGGQISSIGGQISSISANAGTTPEQIDSFLWQPGDYYVVVSSSNGAFSDSRYLLSVQVDGSGLATPPAAPEVALRVRPTQVPPSQITTLYLFHSGRMGQQYPGREAQGQVVSITNALRALSLFPPAAGDEPEYGVALDLSALRPLGANTRTITDAYSLWDANAGNPLYANYIAEIVDNVVEAATTDGDSGDGPAGFVLGNESPVAFPGLRNVVLVGGDNIIPGFRLPDLTTIANEADYAAYLRQADPSGIVGADSAQGAALRYRMITSDNPYGAGRPYSFYGYPFFLPDLAVGRIVETPDDIARYLDYYRSRSGFTISIENDGTKTTAIAAYDFLKDQGGAIDGLLSDAGLSAGEKNLLISDAWTRGDLERAWFDGPIDDRFPAGAPLSPFARSDLELFSLNAHFDHWQLLPAQNPGGSPAGNFPAQRLFAPSYGAGSVAPAYFGDTLGYSVGCHSGLNIVQSALVRGISNAGLYGADFAQSMNRHGGNWIGNTGYGYGTVDGIDYSERIAVLFTQELARDVQGTVDGQPAYIGQSIGAALRNAKQRYVRNALSLSPYDFKALHVMGLYGLPFVRAVVQSPLAPPAEDPQPSGQSVPLESPAPYQPDSAGRLTRTITFTLSITDPDDLVTLPRTGSVVLDVGADDIQVRDEFVERGGRGQFPQPAIRIFDDELGSNNQVGAPVLPGFAYDISAESGVPGQGERLRVKDVIFVGGEYAQIPGFNPQVTQVATETTAPIVDTAAEPSFAAGAGIWYPDKFFSFSSVGAGDEQRDQLVTTAAQFRADRNGVTGLLRPYRQMVFQVIYDDPGRQTPEATQRRADDQAPVIESVQVEFPRGGQGAGLGAGSSQLLLRAYDRDPAGGPNSGIDPLDVSAVFVRDGLTWELVTFSFQGGDLYTATLPVDVGAVRVIIRVTDRAGNTSTYTAKGSFAPPFDRTLVRMPLLRR